jgi:primase-polymerase (primpol)-like protein
MPLLSPIKEKADNDKNAEDDGPNKADGDRIEPETANEEKSEEKQDGSNTETESHNAKDLKVDSSIVYPKPSISKSAQDSSTQESAHDSDGIPEAEAGGPEIISVSSTSKLSASLGVQEEEFANMHKSDLRVLFDYCFQRRKVWPPLLVSALPVIPFLGAPRFAVSKAHNNLYP